LGPCLFHNTGWVKVPVQFLALAVVDFYVPQPAERQRIGNQIDAAMTFALADFVKMHFRQRMPPNWKRIVIPIRTADG
jgi:hypothetical protein